ncbi:hypothetical protein [Algoriphagus resistens]|uniref:hypothetical protein n=1 Tax=Algoriphagus resistens TaxID=1750590 RepID=UPI0007168411|nr:hypothetical protein [Algoriphagus resistens]
MSTWTDVSTYIKTQLKPGVLGNTNVQKILNSVLAIVNQINAGSLDPENDSLWKAEVIYPADTTPVLWQDNWLVSNIADNEGNVPINTAGVVHPTWRIIGSSVGSGIRPWQAIVYPNVLEIIFSAGFLYYLDRNEVGTDPFVSVDFATELAAGEWKILTGGEKGDPGEPGEPGEPGDPGAPGAPGEDGREAEFQVSGTDLQWRLVGDPTWITIFDLSTLGGGGSMTPEQIRDALATLTGDDRLDASAVKGLPEGGSGGGLTKVPFTTALKFDKSYKSETSQTGVIAFTLDSTDLVLADHYSNRYEIEIEANGTGGVPTFSTDFEIQYSDWSNNTGDINQLVFKLSKSGKVVVWLDNVIIA